MMPSQINWTIWIRKTGTVGAMGSVIFCFVTGVFLFFDVADAMVRATHEWTSIVFAGFCLVHIYANKKPLFKYLREKSRYSLIAMSFLGAGLFAMTYQDIYTADAAYARLKEARIADVSPLLGHTPASLIEDLRMKGLKVKNEEQSFSEVAALNGTETHDLLEGLLAQ